MNVKPFYTGKNQDLIRIESNSKDCVVDYDKERGMYRVSIFDDDHFWDEFWFEEYKEKDNTLDENLGKISSISDYVSKLLQSEEEIMEYSRKLAENFDVLARCRSYTKEASNSILETLSSSKIKPYSHESKMQAESKLDEIIHKRKTINEIKDYKECCTCKHFCDDWHEERLWCESDNYDDDDCYER